MPEYRASRGVPLPTVWQSLIVAASVSAIWLTWRDVREPQVNIDVGRNDDPVAEALDNLRTVEAVARTGSEGVPKLVDALADPNFRLRRNALLALRLMGPEADEALASIRERFADEDAQVRSFAIDAYWHIRRDPDDVSSVVAPMLKDPEVDVRKAAAIVLESIGTPAIGRVVELLRSSVSADRRSALAVLRRIGWDASQPQIEEVVRELTHDREVRVDAMQALATWGHPKAAEIRELLQQTEAADDLKSDPRSEPGPRETALRALIREGPSAADSLDNLLDLLEKSPRGGRQWSLALAAVRAMQSSARPAAQRLLRLASDKNNSYRIDVGWTLLKIGAGPQEIVRIAEPLLMDKDTDICFQAGRLYATASPEEARRQVSRLIPLLTPEKRVEGLSALNAVWGLAPEAQEAIPALSRLLECDQPEVASTAARVLGDIGPRASALVPTLLEHLARDLAVRRRSMRGALCKAIGKIGPAARGAVPQLLVELNDAPLERLIGRDLDQVGQHPVGEALLALGRIGDSDPTILAAIRRHLDNDDGFVQRSALRALAQLKPNSPEILEYDLKWLRENREPQIRVGLILAIGQLAGDRQAAVPVLSDLLADITTPEIQKAAAWSLGMIGSEAGTALPALKEALKDWKNSLSPLRSWPLPQRLDDPRVRLEMERWIDPENPLVIGSNAPQLMDKSVCQVVREAIKEIEGRR